MSIEAPPPVCDLVDRVACADQQARSGPQGAGRDLCADREHCARQGQLGGAVVGEPEPAGEVHAEAVETDSTSEREVLVVCNCDIASHPERPQTRTDGHVLLQGACRPSWHKQRGRGDKDQGELFHLGSGRVPSVAPSRRVHTPGEVSDLPILWRQDVVHRHPAFVHPFGLIERRLIASPPQPKLEIVPTLHSSGPRTVR